MSSHPISQRPAPSRVAVVVIGMHRSGTSALAGAIGMLGLAMPHDLMPAQSDNPRGFHEPVGVAELNDRILTERGGGWDRPTIIPAAAGEAIAATYLPDAVAALQTSFGDRTPVILKDPRISLLRPLWERALRELDYEPRYVLIHRNPLDVAASLEARNALPQQHCFRLWLSYVLAALDVEREGRLSAVVGFEELLDQPHFLLTSMTTALGLDPAAEDVAGAVALLDAAERHQRAGKRQFDEAATIPDLVKEVWWLLRRWHARGLAERRTAIAAAQAAFAQLALKPN